MDLERLFQHHLHTKGEDFVLEHFLLLLTSWRDLFAFIFLLRYPPIVLVAFRSCRSLFCVLVQIASGRRIPLNLSPLLPSPLSSSPVLHSHTPSLLNSPFFSHLLTIQFNSTRVCASDLGVDTSKINSDRTRLLPPRLGNEGEGGVPP